ncbi:MAG: FAD-binding oxidoreductase, partial [Chloroflexi bacterium]|nr:FAD-binding oxidoreductase [Chloroflexota bacterium]
MPVDSADVVVIGGGVSGLSSAYFLARAGKDVVVIEKGTVGAEASGRNGGMVSERVDEPPLVPLAAESLKIWPTLDDELGYPTEFTHHGRLHVALTEEQMDEVFAERDEALPHGISVDL